MTSRLRDSSLLKTSLRIRWLSCLPTRRLGQGTLLRLLGRILRPGSLTLILAGPVHLWIRHLGSGIRIIIEKPWPTHLPGL